MRRVPKSPLPIPGPKGQSPEDVKLLLMRVINEEVTRRFRSLKEAAQVTGVGYEVLSRIRGGDRSRCSIERLIDISIRLNITITVDVRIIKVRQNGGD